MKLYIKKLVKVFTKSSIITILLFIVIGKIVYASITWPSGTPAGETGSGKFMGYFNNMFSTCPSGQVVGFTSSGALICQSGGGVGGGTWENILLTDTNNYDTTCQYRATFTDGTNNRIHYATVAMFDKLLFVDSCLHTYINKGTKSSFWTRGEFPGNCNMTGYTVSKIEKNCGGGGSGGGITYSGGIISDGIDSINSTNNKETNLGSEWDVVYFNGTYAVSDAGTAGGFVFRKTDGTIWALLVSATGGEKNAQLTSSYQCSFESIANALFCAKIVSGNLWIKTGNSVEVAYMLQKNNGGSGGGTTGWGLTGNSGTIAGINYIGTSDNQDLIFKRNGLQAGLLNFALGNTAWGVLSLNSNTTGYYNTAIGMSSLQNNTVGYANTANGLWSLRSNINGLANTANGYNSLSVNINGTHNTAIGANVLVSNTGGSSNTAIGYAAAANTTSNYNTANGYAAINSNTTGRFNTAFGFEAGYNGIINLIGNKNTFLGPNTTYSNGAITNATAIGADVNLSNSNTVVIGNNANVGIGTSNPSKKVEISDSVDYRPLKLTSGNNVGSILVFNPTFGGGVQWEIGSTANSATQGGGKFVIVDGLTNSTRMTIKSSDGNLGIGTTNPGEKLTVNGNIKVEGAGNGIIFPDGSKQTTAAGGGDTGYCVLFDINTNANSWGCSGGLKTFRGFAGYTRSGNYSGIMRQDDMGLIDNTTSTISITTQANLDYYRCNASTGNGWNIVVSNWAVSNIRSCP